MTPGAGIFRTKLPVGFTAGGINCGVRRYRPDLGMIISEQACVAAGVFTQNQCKGAPVNYCEKLLPATNICAIITNSGEANAATGPGGVADNFAMAKAVATTLGCDSTQVLTASTGVIGEPLSVNKIVSAIPSLVNSMSNIAEKFAVSILTTDLVPKTVHKEIYLSTGKVCITGICKGSGMIHPNMATMLGYLLTDAKLEVNKAQGMLKSVCDKSFNMISVDGETSTNDSVFLLANGMSGVGFGNTEDEALLYDAFLEVSIELAKSIARDGEGASKLIQVNVNGMADEHHAKIIARSVTTSPLIKTAIYGESPNWGRIIARLGGFGASEAMLNTCGIVIQGETIVLQGAPVQEIDLLKLKKKLKEDTVEICLDFNSGKHGATAWGCDLTEKYVKINAEYVS